MADTSIGHLARIGQIMIAPGWLQADEKEASTKNRYLEMMTMQ
jgi:hypothetical protein